MKVEILLFYLRVCEQFTLKANTKIFGVELACIGICQHEPTFYKQLIIFSKLSILLRFSLHVLLSLW